MLVRVYDDTTSNEDTASFLFYFFVLRKIVFLRFGSERIQPKAPYLDNSINYTETNVVVIKQITYECSFTMEAICSVLLLQ